MDGQVYFLNQSFPLKKNVRQALSRIRGLGSFYSDQICDLLGIGPNMIFANVSSKNLRRLQRLVQSKYFTGQDLDNLLQQDVQKYVKIGSVRGIRHTLGLPVRGQRTRTNARTCRKRRILRG